MNRRNQGLGIALILIGVLVIVGRSFGIGDGGWPIIIVLVGVGLLVAGFVGPERTSRVVVAGSTVTTVGLILFVQNLTGYFQSWAYAWGLVVAGLGLGTFLHAAIRHEAERERSGLRLVRGGLLAFAVLGLFFELFIFGNLGNAWLFRWALPLVLILVGAFLFLRNGRTRTP